MSHPAATTMPLIAGMAALSPRQREILTLVAAGRTSKEIASTLGISESTVNWHLSNAFTRLGASSRAEAVALAMRDEADRSNGADGHAEALRPSAVRPPLPLSSIALTVAVTLVLGLLGGALLAGWDFTPPTPPSSSAAPSGGATPSVDPTMRPTGVSSPGPDDAPAVLPSVEPIGTPGRRTIPPALPIVPPRIPPAVGPLPSMRMFPELVPVPLVAPGLPAVLSSR